jgi:betaine reductase
MVKEIEREGIAVVHVCTVTPISLTVGANRIVPAVAIPHPLGNPKLNAEEEFGLRKKLVEKALQALATPVSEQHVFDS